MQKKISSGIHFFLLDTSYSLYTTWKEIVNRVEVSEKRNIQDQNVIVLEKEARKEHENVKRPHEKIWKLWKINGNVEKIKVKKINSTFFCDKGIKSQKFTPQHTNIYQIEIW